MFGSKPAGGGSLFGSTTNQSSTPFGGAAATSTNTFGTSTNSVSVQFTLSILSFLISAFRANDNPTYNFLVWISSPTTELWQFSVWQYFNGKPYPQLLSTQTTLFRRQIYSVNNKPLSLLLEDCLETQIHRIPCLESQLQHRILDSRFPLPPQQLMPSVCLSTIS